MRAMIMGCVCAGGAGVWALTGSGPDAEAIVHKPPQAVYAAVSSAFVNAEQSSVIPTEDGNSVAFQVTVEREPGSRLESTLLIGGEEAGTIEFTFSPTIDEKGEAATKMTGEIDIDQSVLQKHFADGPNEDVGRIPEFAFDLAMREAMKDIAEKIEQGIPLDGPNASFAEIRARQDSPSRSARESKWAAKMRQREATRPTQAARPMMDPNQSARQYLNQ